jgi:hypothetical protein
MVAEKVSIWEILVLVHRICHYAIKRIRLNPAYYIYSAAAADVCFIWHPEAPRVPGNSKRMLKLLNLPYSCIIYYVNYNDCR